MNINNMAGVLIPGSLADYVGADLIQLGFVTKDLEQAMQFLKKSYGVKKFLTKESRVTDATYEGKPVNFSIKAAHAYIGNLFLEVIQPVSGENPYDKYLTDTERKVTLHHLCMKVADWEKTIADIQKAGFEFSFEGHNPKGGIRFGYIDMTKEMGLMLEFINGGDSLFDKLKSGTY
ncbi:VOC family protein [Bacillus sp. B15-48]|uniref:VOC family protein n=1 Tax=Bacillus sp. B15-48 TaxID=1548601 RepID=UPI00193FD318|nr:VOC family protein [Bacillus sp. B15-48]MBM4763377.1 hypothetical protein [Bacillus sp. B15-48]